MGRRRGLKLRGKVGRFGSLLSEDEERRCDLEELLNLPP